MAKSKTGAAKGSAGKTAKAPERPAYALDDAQRAKLKAEAAAQGAKGVERVRSYMPQRILWLNDLQGSAWRDRAELIGIDVGGRLITEEEIERFGWWVAYLRELSEQWSQGEPTAPSVTPVTGVARAPSSMSLEELREEQREVQKKLLRAFDLRFVNSAEGQKLLRDIRRGDGDEDIRVDSSRVLVLCTSSEHSAWLATLRKGEVAAAERLALLEQEFRARLALPDVTPVARIALGVLRDQVWTIALRTADRINRAGRYMFAEDPVRLSHYGAFRRPKARKKPVE